MNGKVAIVLDPSFGEKLTELAKAQPVWAWDSPANRTTAQRLWDDSPSLGQVTIFSAAKATSAEEAFVYILDTVDQHHPAWSQLLVIGFEQTAAVKIALAEYGHGSIKETTTGFVFERSTG
jgi:hypothetical protein